MSVVLIASTSSISVAARGHVAVEDVQVRAQGPDVDVVHAVDAVDLLHGRDHGLEVEAGRGELQQDRRGLPEQADGRSEDQERESRRSARGRPRSSP